MISDITRNLNLTDAFILLTTPRSVLKVEKRKLGEVYGGLHSALLNI